MSAEDVLVGMTIPPTAFRTSTTGKPSYLLDTPDEEAVYRAIVAASQQTMTLEDVRLMRRIFDRADLDGNRFVDREELRLALKSVDAGDLAGRVLQEILLEQGSNGKVEERGESAARDSSSLSTKRKHAERKVLGDTRWSFPAFVFLLRAKLSEDERLKLMTKEEEFLREMGVDREERIAMEEFRDGREERRRSSLVQQYLKDHNHNQAATSPPKAGGGGSRSLEHSESTSRRMSDSRASIPNDVEEYKREFGIVE